MKNIFVVLELAPPVLEVKKMSSHTVKRGSWYYLGILFKISNKHPLLMGFPLGSDIKLHSCLAACKIAVFVRSGQVLNFSTDIFQVATVAWKRLS